MSNGLAVPPPHWIRSMMMQQNGISPNATAVQRVTEENVVAHKSRALQRVTTHDQRATIVTWMQDNIASHGERIPVSRTVRAFPNLFLGAYKTNLQCASRYWKQRSAILSTSDRNNRYNGHSYVRATDRGFENPHKKKWGIERDGKSHHGVEHCMRHCC